MKGVLSVLPFRGQDMKIRESLRVLKWAGVFLAVMTSLCALDYALKARNAKPRLVDPTRKMGYSKGAYHILVIHDPEQEERYSLDHYKVEGVYRMEVRYRDQADCDEAMKRAIAALR